MQELRRIGNALRALVTRAHVVSSTIGPRTLLQTQSLDGEVFDGVELALPPGYVARPAEGHDVLIFQVNGSRDHKVALGGDLVEETVVDLAPGESGLRVNGRQIVLRVGSIELLGDGEPLRKVVTEIFMQLFNAHTHDYGGGVTGVPNQQMTAAHLTATVTLGGAS